MADPSFDIVSEIDMQEVRNAVDQAQREVRTRFDFKNTGTGIDLGTDAITLVSGTEDRLKAAYVVLTEKFARRNISQKALDPGKAEPATGATYRQVVKLRAGIDKDIAREITKLIKGMKHLKVQAQIQGDRVRVSGKKKDDLQSVMTEIREADLPVPIQFTNYR